jgi:hypothetical protein
LPSTSSEAFPAETGTPETTYIEIEKSDADKANEEEVKKLKAELEEIKKLLEKKNEKPAKKTRAKTSLKKTAAKKDAKKTK